MLKYDFYFASGDRIYSMLPLCSVNFMKAHWKCHYGGNFSIIPFPEILDTGGSQQRYYQLLAMSAAAENIYIQQLIII